MPAKYRGIQFVKEATLLGQRIDLGKNGNKAAKDRLRKAKEACGEIKPDFSRTKN